MKPQNRTIFIISLLIPLAVGALSSLIGGSTFMYTSIIRPALSPPAIAFPIVWTILYILMGISSYIIYTSDSPAVSDALTVYGLQLAVNFGWSIIFFRFSLFLFAFLWLVILIGLIIVMIIKFYAIKPVAAYLQMPYLLWCLFAAYLNLAIYILN